jgi:hypothetical protein
MTTTERIGWDWLIIVGCMAFAATSFLVDPLAAFAVPVQVDSDSAIVRAVSDWATRNDPLWLENPPMLRVQTALSTFVYGPFYLLTMVALLLRRHQFLRVPALVFAGALASNVIIYTVAAFVGYHVASPLLFVVVNLPYLLFAIGLIWRFGVPAPAHCPHQHLHPPEQP